MPQGKRSICLFTCLKTFYWKISNISKSRENNISPHVTHSASKIVIILSFFFHPSPRSNILKQISVNVLFHRRIPPWEFLTDKNF